MPLAHRVLSELGHERGVAVLSAMVDEVLSDNHGKAMDDVRKTCGNAIEVYTDGDATRIQSVIELRSGTDAIYWDNEGLVIFGRSLPETVLASIGGMTVSNIIDALETACVGDLVIASARSDEGALVLETPDCYVTIRDLEDRVEKE